MEAEKVWLEAVEKARVEAEKEKARLEVAKAAEEAPIVVVSDYHYLYRSLAKTPHHRMRSK